MFVLTAKLTAKESSIDKLLAGMKKITPLVASEEGAIVYDVHYSKEKPNQVLVYEIYRDEQAFQDHLASDHYKQLIADIGSILEGSPELTFWENVVSMKN